MILYTLYWYDAGGYAQKGTTIADGLEAACSNLHIKPFEVVHYDTLDNDIFSSHSTVEQ